jgi:dimethylargininase
VFVEDTALVLPEVAVILRPGAPSRRPETTSVAKALRAFRELRSVRPPGTVDGGDVLRVGKKLFVGRSSRTNAEGIDQLSTVVDEFGYEVLPVEIRDCLHLKSAVTQIGPDLLLANRDWLLDFPFDNLEMIDVDPDESAAANALMINGTAIYPANFPATAERMRRRGVRLATIDVSEIQKAEGGVTCCCIPLW